MRNIYYRIELIIYPDFLSTFMGDIDNMIYRGLGYCKIHEDNTFEGYVGCNIIHGIYDEEMENISINFIDTVDGSVINTFVNRSSSFELPDEYILISYFDNQASAILIFKEKVAEKILQREIEKNYEDITKLITTVVE